MKQSTKTFMDSVLCFSSSDWDGKWGSRQQVMMRLAKRGIQVLFVEQRVGLEHLVRYPSRARRRLQIRKEPLRQKEDNLWLYTLPPLLPGRYYSKAVARANNLISAYRIRPVLSTLNVEKPILWVYRPEDGGLFDTLNHSLAVYHCIDEFTGGIQGRKRQVIQELEQHTTSTADLVFANSQLTFQNKQTWNRNIYRIPSGADTEHFRQVAEPKTALHPDFVDFSTGSTPVAGYIGTVNEKLDIQLLVATARKLADWQFLFVGKVYLNEPLRSLLSQQPNIHLAGAYPFQEIPSIMKCMDVCLLPYAQGEYTLYRSPLKLYEYLAAGKPVVSTPHPEVAEYAQWVCMAEEADSFSQSIVACQAMNSDGLVSQRIQVSQQNSWDSRVDEMLDILERQMVSL